jgi:hypothetical protein
MPGFLGGSTSGGSGTGGEISFPKEFIDPVTKLRVSQPENLIDTDFEYGLQPTKWETVELINNTPSFFSKSGDTTIPDIISITTNIGTREITVTTATEHGVSVGIPIQVTGTKSVTADGSYIVNSIPNLTTFTYLCKANQPATSSIEDLYSSIITGEFFQGSQLRIADGSGIVTDDEAISTLTVTTESAHGFKANTPFYFLNLNSTISQEFQASNTAAKSFDSTNSAVAQTFDGSNTLSSINIDWSNSATVGGVTSTISNVNTTNNTLIVAHGTENFANRPIGTPLYYSVTGGAGYFVTNPRGVVFLKSTTNLGTSTSTFQVSATPDGEVIPITAAVNGTIQLANQARLFAGNNTNPALEYSLPIFEDAPLQFDGANTLGSLSTVSLYSGTTIQMQNDAGSAESTGLYVGSMVQYTTTGAAATGLVNNASYFVRSISLVGGLQGVVQISIGALPNSTSAITVSGGTGTQKFRRVGVSIDREIIHVPGNTFVTGDMLRYSYPAGGAIGRTGYTSDYMYVETRYPDGFNVLLKDTKGSVPTGLTQSDPGVSAAQLKLDNGYNTDGVYWITIGGVSQQVYCIMNSAFDGGGWMMMMKATRGTTFNFDASFWETNNTLNATQVNRNDGDAKFNVYNQFAGKDFLALWPDIGQGGSISVAGYPWTWLQNDYFGGTRITPLSFFQTAGFKSGQPQTFGGNGRFIRDAKTFSGWASGVFSSQVDIRFYGFNYQAYNAANGFARVRWGFGWNENGDGLYPSVNNVAPGSNDVSGGIGMHTSFGATGGFSAGDWINCCQDTTGINRNARVEIYVR